MIKRALKSGKAPIEWSLFSHETLNDALSDFGHLVHVKMLDRVSMKNDPALIQVIR